MNLNMAKASESLELDVDLCIQNLERALHAWRERPLKFWPVLTSERILETRKLDYDGKLERWDGYDAAKCRLHLFMKEQRTYGMCMIPPDENNSENTNTDEKGQSYVGIEAARLGVHGGLVGGTLCWEPVLHRCCWNRSCSRANECRRCS
ncbi:hypothetical protein HanRHA438_Chr14g0678411 [Helianthus annuus]|nr:hypothetical protein HanIR_Chr14g0723991 [Helianthus annuus]KAJ0855897.1 hypothetical protein HanRHA438_Chr14g0678411 [Helianthus annuus]